MIDYLVHSQLVLYSLLFIALCSIAWHFVEAKWDARNFNIDEKGIYENLHVRMALYVFDHVEGITPVDTRSSGEFSEGHIPGAINAPYKDRLLDIKGLEPINRDTPLLVYCDGGYASRRAVKPLKEMGFHTIYHIHRGFKSWKFFGGKVESGA